MRFKLPFSLIGFVATVVIFFLQWPMPLGFFLMFLGAMFWSAIIVNVSMIGLAIEAGIGRVARVWLLLPIVFYGGYWTVAISDRIAIGQMEARFENANKGIHIDFDPKRHALVFENGQGDYVNGYVAVDLVENFGVPVTYTKDRHSGDGYSSSRLIAQSDCTEIRNFTSGKALPLFHTRVLDLDSSGNRQLDGRFCNLHMPDAPELPTVVIKRNQIETSLRSLPITRLETTITTPDGTDRQLVAGLARPLPWFPIPAVGCWPNSNLHKWECFAAFMRTGFVKIGPGTKDDRAEAANLARILGLRPVAADDRIGADSRRAFKLIAEMADKASGKSP